MSDEQCPTVDAASSSDEVYSRAVETEPSVTVTEETFFGHGWQPLTIVVLQAVWFMPQGAQFGVEDLVDWFRHLGWKSANGKPLGADAVRRELALIREAGYVRAERVRGDKGRVVGIRYEISKRPRPGAGRAIRFGGDETETRRSHHVPPMATHGGSPDLVDQEEQQVAPRASNGHMWSMGDMAKAPNPQVAPCASNDGHPPHPPEEEDSSSPNPLTRTTGPVPSPREEGPEFSEDELRGAEVFLQQMKTWQAGGSTARKCAPRLLRAMRRQGWPMLADMDDEQHALLESEIFKNTGGAHSWVKCLPGWVDDLRIWERARSRPGAGAAAGRRERCPDHPARYRAGCVECALIVPA